MSIGKCTVVVLIALSLAIGGCKKSNDKVADKVADDTFTNSLGMTFKLIPAGTFTMGSPKDELGRADGETQHQVTLTKTHYMQTTEVTQGQWKAVMGNNPSAFPNCGDDCPMESVSWDDAQAFITELNKKGEGAYRLPTEAEWEYAARAGTDTAYANGDMTEADCGHDPNLDAMGWYCGNATVTYGGCADGSGWGGPSCSGTFPVAQKQANAWGLYDMHGGVHEWCNDWFGAYAGSDPVTDPTGPDTGTGRVGREQAGGPPPTTAGRRSGTRHRPEIDTTTSGSGWLSLNCRSDSAEWEHVS